MKQLLEAAQLSASKLSDALGISRASMQHYLNGEAPSIKALIKLADYFAVPLDYLTGRCSLATANEIQNNYRSVFHQLHVAAYQKYLEVHKYRREFCVDEGYEIPWPYNLLNKIFGDWTDGINIEQLNGLNHVLKNSLSDMQNKVVLLYFGEGLTPHQIGKQLDIPVAQVKSALQESIQVIRRPAQSNLIAFGLKQLEYNEREEFLFRKEKELHKREEELREYDKALSLKKDELDKRAAILEAKETAQQERIKKANLIREQAIHAIQSTPPAQLRVIETLGFSVRVYNALKRAKINTADELIHAAEAGSLLAIHNLGKKSLAEILKKISGLTDCDLYSLYKL